jgi:hypothetical protein
MKIRHRVWDPEHKQMWYPEDEPPISIDTAGDIYYYENAGAPLKSEDSVSMLSTWLKDTTGREIFAGDLLETEGEKDDIYEVLGYCIACNRQLDIEDSKVIGNIYENPDLIQG